MTAQIQLARSQIKGFSFIEVLLSLALVASALVTLMALVPMGLKASRDATNSVIIGHILEDAHERLEGLPLKDGPLDSEPFYYDNEGVFIIPAKPTEANTEGATANLLDRLERRLYRVDIRLVSPLNDEFKKNAPGLKALILTVAWPVNTETGEVNNSIYSRNRETVTYFVNALTGSGWSNIDPDFKPLIEY